MSSSKELWTPRHEVNDQYGSNLDRPTKDAVMFYDYVNNTWEHEFTDSTTGTKYDFMTTLSGSDNKMTNLKDCWLWNTGYGQTWAKCHKTHYISWHIGSIPALHSKPDIKRHLQHNLPGYVGLRFQYRWPDDNSRNYWSNSPVFINKMMIHYYDPARDQTQSYYATLTSCSTSNQNLWPDRYVKDDSRRNNSFRGCYWSLESGTSRNKVRNEQLSIIGASFQMKYNDRGGATHSRCMDIRNLTPMWSKAGIANCKPVIAKPRMNPWEKTGSMELYLK